MKRKPKFSYYLLSCLAMVVLLVNCNSCVEVSSGNVRYGFERYTNFYSSPEKAEKALIDHIAKRTVRVIARCMVINTATNTVTIPYKDVGWGTGTIMSSVGDHSIVQTAYHVVMDNDLVSGDLKRVCDRFAIEQRDTNNIVISTFRGKIEVVASDKESDLAALKVYTNFGVSSAVARVSYLGQSIRIIGYPFLRGVKGVHLSYEKGHISTINMGYKPSAQIRVGASGYFGNSGGAVWNQQGELVGTVNSMVGFRTLGGFVPQPNCLYGAGVHALRAFYVHNSSLSYILRDDK